MLNKNKFILNRYLLVGTCLMGVCACYQGGRDAELRQYIASVKARPAGPIDPIPKLTHYALYAYPKDRLRDPFLPPVKPGDLSLQPDVNRPKQPLEFFPLADLKMVGTVFEESTHFALILAPTGRVYRVKVGDYIGQQNGLIQTVGFKKIGIRELVSGPMGWEQYINSLSLTN